MKNIQLRIEGDQAESLSVSLKQFLLEEWNIEAQTIPNTTTTAKDTKVKLGTVLGAISIVLAIPSFLESKMVSSLTQRLQAKQHLEKLIDWSLHHLPEGNTSIWVELEGKPFLLNSENLAEILNNLQDQDT